MIKLYIGDAIIDITNYIDYGSIAYSDTIDITKAHGGFTIPYIKVNEIAGLDMSRPLMPLTKIYLKIDEEETYWKLSEDKVTKVRKGTTPLYRHEITMIEPTIDLTLRVLPDMTITQPKGTLDNYIYTTNQIANETTIQLLSSSVTIEDGYDTTGVKVDNTLADLSFNYGESNDDTVIDQNILKEVRAYDIGLSYEIYNIQYNSSVWSNAEATIEFTVYADGVEIYSFTQYVNAGERKGILPRRYVPTVVNSNRLFSYTPSSVDEVITVKAQTTGTYFQSVTTPYEDEVWITGLSLNLTTFDETAETSRMMLDDAVDKILLIINQAPLQLPTQEFELDVGTRNKIKDIVCPDMTFSSYTVFEALQELAWYVGAIVYIGEEDWNTIYFYFYDTQREESGITYLDEEHQTMLNDYVTGYEINAQNVVKENNTLYEHIDPSETGFISIRAEDIGEISDSNAIFETSLPLYYESKIIVKGIAFEMLDALDAPVSFASTLEWDLTDFLVEQSKWQGLTNTSSANNRSGILNKGNTFYYTKGSRNIKNITYNDVILAPAWNTATPANYAIIEAVLCQAQIENSTYHFASNYTVSQDIYDLRARVYYMAYSNARATVYKANAAELNEAIRFFNEQSSINDMKRLGDTAQESVNRRGNETSKYLGVTTNIRHLIHLGMTNAKDEKLTSYAISVTPTVRYIALEYSKYSPNISNYVKTPSEHRQWQVPNTDLVYRKDKYKEYVYISETSETPTFSIYEINQLLANFKETPDGDKLTYAQLELDYDGLGYTDKIEATVDVLAFGTTTAIQIELKDNYSAGGTQVTGVAVGPVTQVRQTDTRYTDEYGRVENIKISIYTTHAITDSDIYPANADTIANPESQLELVIKKDAREIWGLTQELLFRSLYQNIYVYSGMALFNGLIAKGSSVQTQPFLLKKGYTPTERLDTTKLIQATWSSTVSNNELYTAFSVPIGEYEGYVWVETNTMTPIFAVKTSVFDTTSIATIGHEIYMFTSFGSTQSFYAVDLTANLSMSDILTIELSTDVELDLTDTLTLDTSLTSTNFIFPIVDLTTTISMTDTIGIEISTDYELALTDTISLSSTLTSYASTDFVIDVAGILALTDVIGIEVSTDIELDITDSISMSSTIVVIKSTDYVIDLSDTLSLSDTIAIEVSTDYETTLTDTLTMTGTISSKQDVTKWTYIGTSATQDETVTYVSSGSLCVIESQARSWLTTENPPSDYAYGYIIRVTRGNEDLSPCSPAAYYYQAT